MPKWQAGDAILDVIANDLRVSKCKTKGKLKSVRCPTGEAPTASLVDYVPMRRVPIGRGQFSACQ